MKKSVPVKKLVLSASAYALMLAGCTPTAHVHTLSKATRHTWSSRSRLCHLTVKRIDGKESGSEFDSYFVVPGVHTFVVVVQCSNGWQDQTELTFEAQVGKLYWILTYELAPDEPEEKAEIRRYTAAEEAAEVGVQVTGPVWVLPIVGYLVYQGVRKLQGGETKERATGRPFERCCFVWVQEEESGTVVAGERPGGEGHQ